MLTLISFTPYNALSTEVKCHGKRMGKVPFKSFS